MATPGVHRELIAELIKVLESSGSRQDETPGLSGLLQEVEKVPEKQILSLEAPNVQRFVAVLCTWLRDHEEFQERTVLRSILRILVRLVSQDSSIEGIAVQKGLLSSCTGLLSHCVPDTAIIRSSLELVAMLSVVDGTDSIISRLGTVGFIIELLHHHQDNSSVLEDAATALAILVKRTRHRRAVTQTGGMRVLVDILKRRVSDTPLIVAISRFIASFCVKEECALTVVQTGGLEALTAAFQGTAPQASVATADARASVASAILACVADCSEAQRALSASGWLSSLRDAMQAYPDHLLLYEAGIGIVRSMSRRPEDRQEIVKLGFISLIIRAMRSFGRSIVLLKEACGAFGNVAMDPELCALLGKLGAIQEVVTALSRCSTEEDRKVSKLGLGALWNLATCSENLDILAQVEAPAVLLSVTQLFMHNENILDYAIGAISHLAVNRGCNKQLLEAGAAEALLLFLAEHREDLMVVSKTLVALRRLAECAETSIFGQLLTAGHQDGYRGLALIVEAMQVHVYDETVVKEAALFLTGFCESPEVAQFVAALATQPCHKALDLHQQETVVADALVGLLSLFPMEEEGVSVAKPEPNVKASSLLTRTPFPLT